MITLEGAIDIHVHAAPELFSRIGDAVQFAADARDAGMAGLVFKTHHEPSMTRAYYAAQQVPEVELYGGLVLNQFVGGLNPVAVAAALRGGARIIWGPTMHARHHVTELGSGTYGVGHMTLPPELASPGISAVDDQGAILPEMARIIALAGEAGATIATGHLGPEDIRAVAAECQRVGTRCLLTHVFFLDKSTDFLLEMAALGVYFEISASVSFPLEHYLLRRHGGGLRLEVAAEFIERVGADRVAISSDCGQIHNAAPVESLRAFLSAVHAVGIPEDSIREMTGAVPRRLLGVARPDEPGE